MSGEPFVDSCLRKAASLRRDSSSLRRATTERFCRMVSNSFCIPQPAVSHQVEQGKISPTTKSTNPNTTQPITAI